jgi:hypothetical protein
MAPGEAGESQPDAVAWRKALPAMSGARSIVARRSAGLVLGYRRNRAVEKYRFSTRTR